MSVIENGRDFRDINLALRCKCALKIAVFEHLWESRCGRTSWEQCRDWGCIHLS